MPRGNDSEAAQHELADRFGKGAGNAEELIEANNARTSRELATLNMLPIDEEGTLELDPSSLSGPNGEPVLSAAVRGSGHTRGTVVVYEDEEGRVHKHVEDYEDGSSRFKRAKDEGGDDEEAEGKAAADSTSEQATRQNVRSQSKEGEAGKAGGKK